MKDKDYSTCRTCAKQRVKCDWTLKKKKAKGAAQPKAPKPRSVTRPKQEPTPGPSKAVPPASRSTSPPLASLSDPQLLADYQASIFRGRQYDIELSRSRRLVRFYAEERERFRVLVVEESERQQEALEILKARGVPTVSAAEVGEVVDMRNLVKDILMQMASGGVEDSGEDGEGTTSESEDDGGDRSQGESGSESEEGSSGEE